MLEYLSLIFGIILLVKGADLLVDSASSLAKRFRVSGLVIGLTVVAFGTSLPELLVNLFASYTGHSEIALGNIIGSNIFNLLFVLGLAAIIIPLKIQKSTIWKEMPIALFAAIVLLILSNKSLLNGSDSLTRLDGVIMLLMFSAFLIYTFAAAKKDRDRIKLEIKTYSLTRMFLMAFIGTFMLFIGGHLTVQAAATVARNFGISEFLISATIIAVGTSLPELMTSLVAVFKKEMDISVGNVVGSNIFNILFILAIGSLINPLAVFPAANYDILFLILSTAIFFMFMFIGKKHELERWQGAMFILLYLAYLIFVITRG